MRFALSIFLAAAVVPSLFSQQRAASIEAPAGARVVLQAKGEGVQIYGCGRMSSGLDREEKFYRWLPQGPDAKLFDSTGKEVGVHFTGPTWRLNDGSTVRGETIATQPAPEAGDVAWLLLRAMPGTASGTLANVAFIRRTETHGGVAAKTACAAASDAGKTVRVPYSATYTFYAAQ